MFGRLHPSLQPAAWYIYRAARDAGLHPRVTSTLRSRSEQQRLYQRYLAGLSPLPAAPPGRSLHEYGLAFDMVTDDMAAVGRYWRSLGGVWYESDPPHLEAPTR